MGVFQTIDYYALRGDKSLDLLHLCSAFEGVKSLSLLPNIAFSLALAKKRLELKNEEGKYGLSADQRLQQVTLQLVYSYSTTYCCYVMVCLITSQLFDDYLTTNCCYVMVCLPIHAYNILLDS